MENLLSDLVNDERLLSADFNDSVLTTSVTPTPVSAIPAEFGLLIDPSSPIGEWTSDRVNV